MTVRSYPSPKARGGDLECQAVTAQERRRGASPLSEVRGGGQEEQPHLQGAAAAGAHEGREELLHVQGQEGSPQPR